MCLPAVNVALSPNPPIGQVIEPILENLSNFLILGFHCNLLFPVPLKLHGGVWAEIGVSIPQIERKKSFIYLHFMCISVLPAFVYAPSVCLEPAKATRGRWSAGRWVLGSELRSDLEKALSCLGLALL